MKFLSFLLIAFFIGTEAGSPQEIAAKIQAHHDKCLKKSNLDQATLAKVRAGDIDESNDAVVEHVSCYCVEAGLGNESGELLKDVIKSKLEVQMKDKDAIEKVMKTCDATEKVSNAKLYFTKIISCYTHNVPSGVKVM